MQERPEEMNKKILFSVILVLIAFISVSLLLKCPKLLGSMSHHYIEQTTSTSDVSFFAQKGDRIKFSLRSTTENGDLDIILYDSKGSIAYELDSAAALECFFTLESTDTYTLSAQCNGFVGKYKVKAYLANGSPD